METCVLDGIRDLSDVGLAKPASAALRAHLETFYAPHGDFLHEDIFGKPIDNQPCPEENGGHAAVAAFELGEHRGLDLTAAFFTEHWNESVPAIAHSQVAAETAYSVAYPMMALAQVAGRQNQELADKALCSYAPAATSSIAKATSGALPS